MRTVVCEDDESQLSADDESWSITGQEGGRLASIHDSDRVGVAEYPLKRLLDVSLASLGLLVSTPLWVVFALAIKIEDNGPVFYRQKRVGRYAEPFSVLKFRTLVENADQFVHPSVNPGSQWVTRVGRLLRRTALDELPQLLNILSGDMSFVGPRAMPVSEFEECKKDIPGLHRRLYVRPGLTGVAQVYGKATRNARNKLRYDKIYIANQRLALDLKLILASFALTFRGKWEKSEGAH